MTHEKKSCQTCRYSGMDMDMDPYCAHPEVLKVMPWGARLVGLAAPTRANGLCTMEHRLWEESTKQPAYSLYCVEHADSTYSGPFDTPDEVPLDRFHAHIRRCRRVRASELDYSPDYALERIAEDATGFFDWLVNELDDAAGSGGLPDAAWCNWNKRIVHGLDDTGTQPTFADFGAWLDTHMRVDAYICEGDE